VISLDGGKLSTADICKVLSEAITLNIQALKGLKAAHLLVNSTRFLIFATRDIVVFDKGVKRDECVFHDAALCCCADRVSIAKAESVVNKIIK